MPDVLDSLRRDVRHAIRALALTPGFSFTAISVLALSVGACTVVFSIINAVYFRPPPFRDLARLVLVRQRTSTHGCASICPIHISPLSFPGWRKQVQPTAELAAGAEYWGVVTTRLETTNAVGAAVTANFFSVLGISTVRGRTFVEADDWPGAECVMILGYPFWRDAFLGDTTILGSAVRLDNRFCRIIGIMGPENGIGRPVLDVDDPALAPTVPFFIPAGSSELGMTDRPAADFRLVARLRPGGTAQQLAAQIASLMSTEEPSPSVPVVAGLRHELAKEYGGSYPIFLGAVLLVLAVACGNLASLFLARLSTRRREIAISAALGATRARLVRRFLLEGMLIALIGSAVAVSISLLGVSAARTMLPTGGVPYWTHIAVDGRVLLFALAASGISGLMFGIGPALMVTREATRQSMREGGSVIASAPGITAARRYLVSIEIAVTLVLLASAGLLGETFLKAAARDTGMVKGHLATAVVDARAFGDSTPRSRRLLAQSLVERIAHVPDVRAAAAFGAADEPAEAGLTRDADTTMIPPGIAPSSASVVSPGYFATVGMPLTRGREFMANDGPDAPPVAMLSDATAHRLFALEDPIGRRVKFGPPSSRLPWLTIVGVVRETGRALTTGKAPPYHPVLYRPSSQVAMTHIRLMIRTRGPSSAVLPAVRMTIRDLAPNAPVTGVTTIDATTDRFLAPLRLNAVALAAFAILAMVIAALGISGTIAFLIQHEARAIGVRMALGAQNRDVVMLQMKDAAATTLLGIACGLIGSYVFTQLLRSVIYDVSPTDPRVLTGAAALLAAVALAAAYVPARRAASVDPVKILKSL